MLAGPVTVTTPLWSLTVIGWPLVDLMLTVSATPLTVSSGAPEPRSMATCWTPVPVRSLIVMVFGVLP